MALNRSRVAAVGAALLISSCSFATDALWPSLTGEEPSNAAQSGTAQTSQSAERTTLGTGASASPPSLGKTRFVPPPVTAAQPTGTFVGQKVGQLRRELGILQTNVRQRNGSLQEIRRATTQNAQRYHGTVAAVNARLQLGTTPGNPVLVSQWNTTQSALDRIGLDIAAMNSLANSVAADSAMVSYLLETTRATYGLQGAIDEDHRQLAILEDETNRTLVLIDRLLNELSEDISRQTAYVGNERRSLTAISLAIKNGEYYGQSLTSRAYLSAAPLSSAAPAAGGGGFAATNRRPLVVIRFDRADVPYQQALYNAVSRALERRPQAAFELVAVTPSQGTPAENALNASKAKRHADDVLRTLTEMGLPANRVNLSSTTSTEAATNEVHIYVQ